MAVVLSDTGKVTSWAGTGNSALISGGVEPYSFALNISRADIDATPFGSSAVTFTQAITGIYEWDVSIEGQFAPAVTGATGLVTGTTYAANVKSWTMEITCPEKDSTAFNASGVLAKTFLPGLVSWGGTYVALLDGTTAIAPPDLTVAAATFKIVEDGASDHTLAGNIRATQVGVPVRVGELVEVTYQYKGTGTLTAAGGSGATYTNPIFAAGALTRPAVGSLVLQAVTSRTYTGDAFFTRVGISVGVADKVTVNVNAKGTGALSIA